VELWVVDWRVVGLQVARRFLTGGSWKAEKFLAAIRFPTI
jgi:hypothetical protein